MAVYKATYCYPFLNTFDGRVTATTDITTPAQYLKCKIETSNKIVTGYSIEIYDENNNRIFPYSEANKKVSPIVELPQNLGNEINTGYNGTYLHIPFFQNNSVRIKAADELAGASYNAVYYTPRFKANYLLGSGEEFSGVNNIANWVYDEGTHELYYEGFNGILNEELLVENEVIFAASQDSDMGGMWYVQSTGRLARYSLPGDPSTTVDVAYFIANNCKVVITNGKYHGCVYEPVISGSSLVSPYFRVTTDGMWQDCDGNLINFTNEAGNYKWVITLYQSPVVGSWNGSVFVPDYRSSAEGILKDANGVNIDFAHLSTTHDHPWYCDYSGMPIDWYDMSLNRGTVLGSTKDRIQIADQSEKFLPGDGSTEPIVIQGRYVQLLDANEEQIGVRAYITSYDASYGHIYPQPGAFTNDLIGTSVDTTSAVYAQVFKYSNDPTAITANDSVKVATTTPITLSGAQTIDGVPVTTGDYVLVQGQNDSRTNGIYIVSSDTTWSRSGSYKTWGSFIGKVFFVQEGSTNGGKNFISQARAGGTLYIEGQSSTGSSPLTFTEEQPILLFPNLINRTVTFINFDYPTFPVNVDDVSGVAAKDGDTALHPVSSTIYRYDSSGDPKWTAVEDVHDFEGIFQILYGVEAGKYYTMEGTHLVSTPVTAKILKNTTTKTYIKPYVGLDSRMALSFANNIKITYSDLSQKNYLLFTSVNTKLWSVTHEALANALPSWGTTVESNVVPYSYDIKSFYKASDENPFSLYDTPYLKLGTGNGGYTDIETYEPFFVKDNDLDDVASKYFCVFYKNHGDFILNNDALYNMSDNKIFQVIVNNTPFYVKKPSITALASRYITLQGNYYQWQQASWESYRWILTDIDGNILQDTGKKYDKSMTVTFYGLSNESFKYKNQYYAILLVEDSLGQSLSFSIHIIVDPNSITTVSIPFFAEYDCNTHSVALSYQSNSFVKPSIIIHDGDAEALAYVSNNVLIADIWDQSLVYTTLPSWGSKASQDGLTGRAEIDWMNVVGTNASTSNEVFNWLQQQNYLSNTELLGVKYQYYFERRAQTQDATTHFLSTLEQENNSGGEFSLQTRVKLPDNFCANIIETAVDYGDKVHQLHIQLSMPLRFTDLNSDVLNADRNSIAYNIFTDEGASTSGFLLTQDGKYKWRSPASGPITAGASYYFLQSSLSIASFWGEGENSSFSPNPQHEYLHYNSFIHPGNPNKIYYPFFITLKDKNVVNSTKFLGNLGLVSDDDLKLLNAWKSSYKLSTNDLATSLRWDGNRNFFIKQAPCYWSENHHYIKMYQRDGYIRYPMNMLYEHSNLAYHNESDTPLYWPTDTDETNFYWEEYGSETDIDVRTWRSKAPARWSTIFNKSKGNEWDGGTKTNVEASGWKILSYFDRNYSWLSNYSFLITIRVKDIDMLAANLSSVLAAGEAELNDPKTYVTRLLVDETEVGSISIAKIRDSDDTKIVSY